MCKLPAELNNVSEDIKMFRCQATKELSKPYERPYTLVVERRNVEYDKPNGEKAYGWEVAREIKILERNLEKAKKKFGLE